jgi:hypothetical protein
MLPALHKNCMHFCRRPALKEAAKGGKNPVIRNSLSENLQIIRKLDTSVKLCFTKTRYRLIGDWLKPINYQLIT